MAQYSASLDSDGNHYRFGANDAFKVSSTWTFAAATTGAATAHTLFTVTGEVLANVFGVCATDVTGSGTGEVGVTGNTTAFIAQTTGTAIDAGEVWQNATPTVGVGAVVSTPKPVTNGLDIILTIATDTFTAGVVTFYCIWRPLSTDGNIEVAVPA